MASLFLLPLTKGKDEHIHKSHHYIQGLSYINAIRYKIISETHRLPFKLTETRIDRRTNKKRKVLSIFKFVGDELHIAHNFDNPSVRPKKFTKDNTGIYKKAVEN